MEQSNKVVVTSLDQTIEASVKNTLNDIHKKAYKFAKKAPEGLKLQPTKTWQNEMSEYVATRQILFSLDEKLEFTTAYWQKIMGDLLDKDELTPEEKVNLNKAQLECRKAQAYAKHVSKGYRAKFQPLMKAIADGLYNAYLVKDDDYEAYIKTITAWMSARYNMVVGRNFVEFIAHNTGAKSTNVRNWDKSSLSHMNENEFSMLVANAMLQVAQDYGYIKDKVVRATIKNVTNFTDVDYNEITMFEHIDDITKVCMIQRLEQVKANRPTNKNAKREEWLKAYKKALRDGMFIEY